MRKSNDNSRILSKSKISSSNDENLQFHQHGLSKVTSHSIISKLHKF